MIGFTGIFTWLDRTLTRKFILLLVGFLFLQGAQLFIGVFGNLHLGEEAALINDAGRQRLRTLRLLGLTHQAVIAGSWSPAQRRAFDETLADYETYFSTRLDEFVEGRSLVEELLDAERQEPARALFAEAQHAWQQEMKHLLLGIDPSRPRNAQIALARYEKLATLQGARLDQAVTILEDDTRSFSRQLALMQGFILGLSLLLGLVGLVMARYVVTLPLRRLISAARAVTGGTYDRRIPVSSQDELGELAQTFNRMVDAIGEKTERIMSLNRMAAAIAASLSVKDIVHQILSYRMGLSGMQAVSLTFYDADKGQFGELFVNGLPDKSVSQMQFGPAGLANEALTSGEPVLCSDHPQGAHRLSQFARDAGIRSCLCLPLLSYTNRLGVLCFYRKDSETFTAEETSLLSAFARLTAQAVENARLYARLEEEARTDTLTGLYNRRVFDGRMEEEHRRAKRYGKPYAIALLDIDYFKRINDDYGHPAGDAVLVQLSRILTLQVRDVDTVARYGGEEFIVIFPEISGSVAKEIAERMRRAVAETAFLLPDGQQINITVSIGVSCFPNCAADVETAINTADQALYAAKQSGRNRVTLYRETLKARLEKKPGLIVELLNENIDNVLPIATAVSSIAPYLRQHASRASQAAALLAQTLVPEDRENLRLAALLHDIGMLTIPAAILNKTTDLSREEWALIQQHPATGAAWLTQVPALQKIVPLVRHHHERFDGKGYPDGLRGENIPLLARVLALTDAYAALVSDWPGRHAVSLPQAKAEIRAGAGTQFDPVLVERFLQALETKAP